MLITEQKSLTRIEKLEVSARVAKIAEVNVVIPAKDLLAILEDHKLFKMTLLTITGYSDTIGNSQPRPYKLARELAFNALEQAHDLG